MVMHISLPIILKPRVLCVCTLHLDPSLFRVEFNTGNKIAPIAEVNFISGVKFDGK